MAVPRTLDSLNNNNNKRARFEHKLQQCRNQQRLNSKTVSELWNAYLEYQPQSSDDYEQLLHSLSTRAQETRRSLNWGRIVRAYQDALDRGVQRTKPMVLIAIMAYGRTGQFDKAQVAFEELQAQGLVDENAYRYLMDAALDTNLLQMAQDVIRNGRREGVLDEATMAHCVNRFVQVSIRKSNLARALAVLHECGNTLGDHSNDAAIAIWNGYRKAMDMSILNTIDPMSLEAFVHAFTRRMLHQISVARSTQALYTSNHLSLVMDLVMQADSTLVPTAKTQSMLLAAYASEKKMYKMGQMLQSTHAMASPSSYTHVLYKTSEKMLDKDGHAAFIQAFVDAKDIKAAQRVALDMQKRSLVVDINSHMTIVQGWVQQGQPDRAMAWLEKCKYHLTTATPQSDPIALLDTYAAVLEGWLTTGEWSKCASQYRALKSMGLPVDHNRRMIKSVISAQMALGDFAASKRLLHAMPIQFTPMTIQRITLGLLGLKNGSVNRVSGHVAMRGLLSMEKELGLQVSLSGLGRIIGKLGERGDLKEAFALYRNARSNRFDSFKHVHHVFKAMMDAATLNNDMAKAERVFLDMTGWYQQHHASDPPLSSFNMLLNNYASRQPLPHAGRINRTFRDIMDHGYEPDTTTYNILIKAFVNLSNMPAAYSIFQRMIDSGQKPDSWTINTLIQGWVDEHDMAGVKQFMLTLAAHGLSMDNVSYNLLVEGLLRLDRKKMSTTRLARRRNEWSLIKQHQHQPNYSLSGQDVWTIFESVVGVSQDNVVKTVQHQSHDHKLVYKNKPDDITFKLFIKAFQNANDHHSASIMQQFWKASL
ncbi:hypothetical protein K492DRAFT_194445 [Lichtheimia hyalospora FSU 10163]|nr:hypothetical protein K492DRAFT_194445 [Lichtheimia hyalospora FSU 10163]